MKKIQNDVFVSKDASFKISVFSVSICRVGILDNVKFSFVYSHLMFLINFSKFSFFTLINFQINLLVNSENDGVLLQKDASIRVFM